LAWLNIYQNLKQIIQDAIAPEIQSIKGDIKALESHIAGVEGHLTSLESQVADLGTDWNSFKASMEKRFEQQNRQWELAMEVRERLASLEAQVKAR